MQLPVASQTKPRTLPRITAAWSLAAQPHLFVLNDEEEEENKNETDDLPPEIPQIIQTENGQVEKETICFNLYFIFSFIMLYTLFLFSNL